MKVKLNQEISRIRIFNAWARYRYGEYVIPSGIFDNIILAFEELVNIPINFINLFRGDKIAVKDSDLWNLDRSLAKIILVSLKRFRENTVSCPQVDEDDAPGISDEKERWDHVVDSMIEAFEIIVNKDIEDYIIGEEDDEKSIFGRRYMLDDEARRIDYEKTENGLRLFGKYFQSLWI